MVATDSRTARARLEYPAFHRAPESTLGAVDSGLRDRIAEANVKLTVGRIS